LAWLLPILVAAAWLWWSGHWRKLRFGDGAAAAALLVGLRFAATGRPLPGLILVAGAALWAWQRLRRPPQAEMELEEASRLLGIARDASLEEIREAHRRMIARVHPDSGGSELLAARVNLARDTLVAHRSRNLPSS
jgi:hypothetical protein